MSASSWWKLDKSKIAVSPENMSYEETLEYRFEHAVDTNTKKIYLKYCRQIAIQTNTYTYSIITKAEMLKAINKVYYDMPALKKYAIKYLNEVWKQ